MKFNNLIILFTIFSIFKFTNAGYIVTFEGNKLNYIGTNVNQYVTNIVLRDPTQNYQTINIALNCVLVGKDDCNCKSVSEINLKTLIGSHVTFLGRNFNDHPTKSVALTGIPLPTPTLEFKPSTVVDSISIVTGNFLRFGNDFKTLKCIVGGKPISFMLDPQYPKDATNFTVKSIGGSGEFTCQIGVTNIKASFENPTITSVGFDVAGDKLLINGTNFYNDKSTTEILVGDDIIPSSSIVSVSDNEIIFSYEPKYTINSPIKITINKVTQSEVKNFQWKPMLLSVNSLPKSGGILTITGKCLKSLSDSTETTTVTVGPYNCPVVQQKSTQIICSLPAATVEGGCKNLNVLVTIDGFSNSHEFQYSFGVPIVQSIVQKLSTFTIYGENLGIKTISKIVIVDQTNSEIVITPIGDDDLEKSLTFKLPPSIYSGTVCVKHVDDKSNDYPFTAKSFLDKPIQSPPTSGGELIISGYYINPDTMVTVQIENDGKINTVECKNVLISGDGSKIKCDCDPGTGNLFAVVTIGGESIFKLPFSYQSPSNLVSYQKPNNTLEFQGKNFGANASLCVLILNDKPIVASSLTNNNTVLTFKIPFDSTSDNNAIIIVDGVLSDHSKGSQVVLRPMLSSIKGDNVTVAGGKIIIKGQHFDSTSEIIVNIGKDHCKNLKVINSTDIECTAPKGTGKSNLITLTIDDKPLNSTNINNVTLSYAPPTVKSCTKVELYKGGIVTVYGTNFNNHSISVTIDSRDCKNITVVNPTKLRCSLPGLDEIKIDNSNITTKSPVNVIVDGQSSGNANVFEYGKPLPVTVDSTDSTATTTSQTTSTEIDINQSTDQSSSSSTISILNNLTIFTTIVSINLFSLCFKI